MREPSSLSCPVRRRPAACAAVAAGLALAFALTAGAGFAQVQAQVQAAATEASVAQVAPAATAADAALARFVDTLAGDGAAIERSAAELQRLSEAQAGDPVLRAYAGAAVARRATGTWLPWKKLAFAEEGLALIDKALAQLEPAHDAPLHRGVPAVLDTRFVAATTFLALPAMFNRQERGRKLLAQVLASPLLEAAPLPFRASVWMRAAQLADETQDPAQASAWYEKVASSQAPQAEVARRRLGSR